MKKLISLLLALMIVFVVAGCTQEPSYEQMKEIEDKLELEIRTDLEKEFEDLAQDLEDDYEKDLQYAVDRLVPEVITNTVYEEVQFITQEVPRDPTDKEWDDIRLEIIADVRAEVTKENDEWLKAEQDKLTPIEVEVEVEIKVPIEGDEYSHGFMTCIVFPLETDPFMVTNGKAKETIVGSLFSGSYTITLEESLPNGTKTLEYNKSTFSVCWFTFGDKPTDFDSLYPNLIPMIVPEKVEETE